MRLILTIWMLLCCGLVTTAQERVLSELRLRCEKLPTQDQLPVANVHRIMQDSEGYFWYATEGGGLCRDNGYKIDVFRNDRNHPGLLATNDITSIAEDVQGRIWFGTTKAGYILDKSDYSIRPMKDIGEQGVSFVFRRHNGEMLVAVVGKIYHFSPQGKLLYTYPTASGRTDAWTTSFAEDKQHQLYVVVVNDDIYRLDEQQHKLKGLGWPYSMTPNYIAADTVQGGLWVGTWGLGVVRYKKDFRRVFDTVGEDGVDTFQSQILNLVVDQQRHLLWVTTMEDVYAYRIQGETLEQVDISAVLPEGKKIIDYAILDRNGNLWVPGYSPHTFIITSADSPIRRDAVQPMSDKTGYRVMVDNICRADGDGFYWIWQGRTNLSLYHAASGDFVFSTEQTAIPPLSVSKCMVPDRAGHYLWAATGADLLRVWHEGLSIRSEHVATASAPISALCDAGDAVWVGTDDGIEFFDKKTHQDKVVAKELGTVRDLRISSDGFAFFVSTKIGFGVTNAEGKTEILESEGDFTSVAISADNTVWAATTGGSVFFANPSKRISSITAEQSKEASNGNGDSVKDIEVDSRGHVWILSDQYLKEYNPKNHASRIIRNTDKGVDMDYFHTIRADADSLFLGGIGAFCLLSPSERLENTSASVRPRVTTYYIDGRELYCGTDEISIPKGTREAVLCVSTFDPLHAAHIRIAYRLSSGDEWTELEEGQNRIYLRLLEPGSYTLEVRATDEYGRWSDGVECLTIRQLDDWWRMPWVQWVLALLLIGSVGFAVFHYRRTLSKVSQMLMPRKLKLVLNSKKELEKLRAKSDAKQQADAEFVERVRQMIVQHLDDSDFGVVELSSSLFMSRMNLYRRLQAVTGLNPADFIRNIRLEKAAELLLTTTLSVSEVSDRTGFGTSRSFSRSFKDKYGILPKDFRTQKLSEM